MSSLMFNNSSFFLDKRELQKLKNQRNKFIQMSTYSDFVVFQVQNVNDSLQM